MAMEGEMERLWVWLCRQILNATAPIDWSLKKGDIVISRNWNYTSLEVIDVNWAMRSVAVRLDASNKDSGIVVWPLWSVKKA